MKKPLLRKIALILVLTHLSFLAPHRNDVAQAVSPEQQQAAFSTQTSFVSFDAVRASQADPFTGSSSLSIPLFLPPARKGLSPAVSLQYSSRAGNGWLGMGWNFDPGFIARQTRHGRPAYDAPASFVLNFGGASTELVSLGNQLYQAKKEALFLRIKKLNADGWELTDKSGTRYLFGTTAASQLVFGSDIFSWHLERIEDTNGNYMTYSYSKDHRANPERDQIYPAAIDYNGHTSGLAPTHHVNFHLDQADRADAFFSYRSGYRVQTSRLLRSIEVLVSNELARAYHLEYTASSSTGRALLTRVTEQGPSGETLPSVELTYTQLDPAFALSENPIPNNRRPASMTGINTLGNPAFGFLREMDNGGSTENRITLFEMLDLNGDGLLDRVMKSQPGATALDVQFGKPDGSGFEAPTPFNGLAFLDGKNNFLSFFDKTTGETFYQLVDINGDGLPDRVLNPDHDSDWEIQFNSGTSFEPAQTSWPIDVSGNTRGLQKQSSSGETLAELADLNGDGFVDRILQDDLAHNTHWRVQFNTGHGFSSSVNWPIETPAGFNNGNAISLSEFQNPSVVSCLLSDLNGDGLPDRLMQPNRGSNQWQVQFNNGQGFEPLETWGNIQAPLGNDFSYPRVIQESSQSDANTYCDLLDINADGLPDRVMVGGLNPVPDRLRVQLNTGTSFATATDWPNLAFGYAQDFLYVGQTLPEGALGMAHRVSRLAFMDIDGDGLLERVMQAAASPTTTEISSYWKQEIKGEYPDLLLSVKNGRGGMTRFTYAPSTRFDNRDAAGIARLPFPVQVVTSITLEDGRGHQYTTSYDYQGGRFDPVAREFHGFSTVRVNDPDGNITEELFYQDFPFSGKLQQRSVYDASGTLWAREAFIWNSIALNPDAAYAFLQYEDHYTYDANGQYRRTRQEFSYDAYGNLLQTLEQGEYYDEQDHRANVTGDERTTRNTYCLNMEKWILNALSTTQLHDASGTLIAKKLFYYDNATSLLALPTLGNLTRQEAWLSDGPNPVTTLRYDLYGNLIELTDPRGNITQNFYDSQYHQFLTRARNALGHEQSFTYSPLLAALTSSTDANGQRTETFYDDFGRVLAIVEPGDTREFPTRRFEYRAYCETPAGAPFQCERRIALVKDDSAGGAFPGYLASYSFFDGLNRKIETRVESADPARQLILDMVSYDSRGQVSRQYAPAYGPFSENCAGIGAGTAFTEFIYDALGRKTKTVFPDGSSMTLLYSCDSVTETHAASDGSDIQTQTEKTDAYGRVRQVHQSLAGATLITRYTYDARDQIIRLQDCLGNTTTMTYDTLGRKTELTDPDTGTTRSAYDLNDNLIWQQDANGNLISHAYDALNRLTLKTYSDPDTEPVLYTYDDPAAGFALGRLTKISNGLASLTYSYDARGQVIAESQEIGGSLYGFQYEYDSLHRKTQITYPDQSIVRYTYNDGGGIAQIGNDQDPAFYVREAAYAPGGMLEHITYGNGVSSTWQYDPLMQRLAALQTRDVNQNLIQDFTFTFDAHSNLKHVNDHLYTATQSFDYDALNRLTLAEAPQSYGTRAYAYDALGNLTQKHHATFYYAENGAGPHQLTRESDGRSFQYDGNGNMIRRGADTLVYDAENRLKILSRGGAGSFSYTLVPGWNLVSFPYLPENKSIEAVLSPLVLGQDYDQVSTFETTTHSWAHFVGDSDFNDFTTFDFGKAYEIYLTAAEPKTLTVAGALSRTPVVLPLAAGKNYFGSVGEQTVSLTDSLGHLSVEETIKRFNNITQAWEILNAQQADFLPGSVYALLTSQPRQAILPAQAFDIFYTYGPRGERLQMQEPGRTHFYIGNAYELSGTESRMSIFMDQRRVAEFSSSEGLQFLHPDHLNSTHIVTDASGEKIARYEYLPFGDPGPSESAGFKMSYQFTGQKNDAAAGLYYYNARYYDPALGRFLQPDSLVQAPFDPQTLNRYAYARNNPVRYIDPTGHLFFAILIGAILGGLSAGVQSHWDLNATLVGSVIGGIAGGFASPVSAALHGGAIGAAAGGAVGGAVAGGLNAAYYGTNITKGIALGAGYGALGGFAYGSLGAVCGETWTLSRVMASGLIGGSMSAFSGNGFWQGVAFSSALAGSQYLYRLSLYHTNNGEVIDPSLRVSNGKFKFKNGGQIIHGLGSPESDVGVKLEISSNPSLATKYFSAESSPLLRFLSNVVPGLDPMAEMHDLAMAKIEQLMGSHHTGFEFINKSTILPAYGITLLGAINEPMLLGLTNINTRE